MLTLRKTIVITVLSILSLISYAQDIPEHPSRTDIYSFLSELADLKVINFNPVAQPLSRKEIYTLLHKAGSAAEVLSRRQQMELVFYLEIYGFEFEQQLDTVGFYFGSLMRGQGLRWPGARYDLLTVAEGDFRFTLNPVAGYGRIYTDRGWMFRRWNGMEAYASMGEHWSLYTSLRDNHESIRLTDPNYLNDFQGANYKLRGEGGDYSEMRTGITYSWDWGYFSLRKDHFVWGTNKHGANIFSGHQPSFPYVELSMKPLKWFEFRYIHAWMVSEIIDSARTYIFNNSYGGGKRLVFVPKNLAANLISIRPFKRTWISLGNSVVYSDLGTHPAFLLPLGFFKSIDHTITGTGSNWLGQNSQMFADISFREIRKLHLHSTLFVDEISFSNMWDKDKSSNFVSFKGGATITDFPARNLSLDFEYTRNNPLVFQHNIPMTSFASNQFNLGHYLRDNSEELFLQLAYKPLKNLHLRAFYIDAKRGRDYNQTGGDLLGLPFISHVVWGMREYGASVSWQVLNNVFIDFRASNQAYHGLGDLLEYTPAILMIDGMHYDFAVRIGR